MSEYAYNPLTGGLDRIGDGGGGGGGITGITADEGGQTLGPSINLVGQTSGDSLTEILSTIRSGTNLYIEPRAYETPYVVDPSTTPGTRGTYTTIQSAIDAAVVDGANYAVFKVIQVRPGVYTENLNLPGGIFIVGSTPERFDLVPAYLSLVEIIGNHSLSGTCVCAFKNVLFTPDYSNPTVGLFNDAETFIFSALYLYGCSIVNGGVNLNNVIFTQNVNSLCLCDHFDNGQNTGYNFSGGTTYISMSNCTTAGDSYTPILSTSTTTTLNMRNCDSYGSITIGDGAIDIISCFFKSQSAILQTTGTLSGQIIDCSFDTVFRAAINNTVSASNLLIQECNVISTFAIPPARLIEDATDYYCPPSQAGNISQVKLITADYAISLFDHVIYVNSASACTISLLDLTDTDSKVTDGQKWTIKDVSFAANVNNITIDVTGAGALIDGQATQVINQPGGSLSIRKYNTNYYIE